ncbi:MAG: protein kinase domain-containing protein, partial [Myxococcaceae bacterium]
GFSLPETLALMRQLCSGLDFIHARGFVHRDIKAGNIFIAPDGHATILDFGILRDNGTEALTRTGMVMGTPQYMSPEQALGARDVDHRADLYALAVLLYECLTGTLPFEAQSELQLVQMHAHHAPPDMLERAPWIPRPVAAVVTRALAKRPEDRFPSAGALLAALEAAAAGGASPGPLDRPSVDPRPSGPAHTAPSRRRIAGAVFPGPLATPQQPAPKKDGPDTAFERKLRRRRVPLYALGALVLLALGVGAGRGLVGEDPIGLADSGGGELALAVASDAGGDGEDGGDTEGAEDGGGEDFAIELASADPDAGDEAPDPGPPDAGRMGKHPMVRHPPQGGTGKVNVVTTHAGEPYWALVLVDGVARGRSPLMLELPAGKHLVRVDRTGFRSVERQIKVASGRLAVVRITLSQ